MEKKTKNDPFGFDTNVAEPSKRKKNNKKVLLIIILACLCLAAITAALILSTGILKKEDDAPETSGVIVEPLEWAEVSMQPYALLKVTQQSKETTDIDIYDKGDFVSCVKCICEVLFFNEEHSKLAQIYELFDGVIYVPVNSKEDFVPGAIVLTELFGSMFTEVYFLPRMDNEHRPVFIPFIDEKLSMEAGFAESTAFSLIKKANKEIDKWRDTDRDDLWIELLPKHKLESGMSVEETIEYLSAILSASEEYYKYFDSMN